MERRVDNRTILDKFVEEFCKVLGKHAVYIVCSGFVSIAHGRTRGTEDIDIIIEKLSEEKFSVLHQDLNKGGFECMQSNDAKEIFCEYLSKGDSVRYVRKSEGYFPPEAEIKFAKDELDEVQLRERIKLPLTGLNVYFSSVESNIAFKEELLGTDKDIEDAKHLRIVYQGKIDEGKINNIKEAIRGMRKKGAK